MSEPSTSSAILDTVAVVARGLWSVRWSWYLSWLGRLIALPLRLLWIPLSYAASFFLALCAPAIYIASYLWSCVRVVLSFVASLEFGTAAAIGIICGLVVGVSSSLITTNLGMYDDAEGGDEQPSDKSDEKASRDLSSAPQPFLETDWYWDASPVRHRRPSGLLSQTIHEEDDDSDL
ncbi:hypothetical protein DCS_03805 [Drechmeria coniospora]|uniref:Uncharacterized protein n=1 Tax=Drechmeria coniospora TaxID=98403 RepID=A0A151GI96_DRECN|nr:hypothetical protein DCS_03805 [Drechmeria coniospora]KYK56799.1 hypothetical protein DCS_03805 [Drechmeria coniospora]